MTKIHNEEYKRKYVARWKKFQAILLEVHHDGMELDMNNYVSEFDEKTQCGTICCHIGWAPKYLPEGGITWEINPEADEHASETWDMEIEFEGSFGGHAVERFATEWLRMRPNTAFALLGVGNKFEETDDNLLYYFYRTVTEGPSIDRLVGLWNEAIDRADTYLLPENTKL